MSLKDCYAKLGKIISKDDQDKIEAISKTLIDQGVSKAKAESQAVGTVLSEVEANLESIALRAKDSGANVRMRKPKTERKLQTFEQDPFNIDEAIERDAFEQVENNFDQLVEDYAELEDAMGGKVMNTDVARELFDAYIQDRTKAPDVHRPSSNFVKRLFERKIHQDPEGRENPTVLYMGGGAGSGKTTSVEKFMDLDEIQLVYDTTMSKYDSARKKIELALDAGKDAHIVMVYRDIFDSFANGALPRAVGQEQEFGTGRTIPIDDFIETHRGSAQVISQLAKVYKDNPRVKIQVIDNSHGWGNATFGSVESLEKVVYDETVRDALLKELRRAYEAKEISTAIYQGFRGKDEEVGREPSKRFEQPKRSPDPTKDPREDLTVKNGYKPKKTKVAYKLFRIDPRYPEQIFPLFLDANTPVALNEWVDAEIASDFVFTAPNGRNYVPSSKYKKWIWQKEKWEWTKTGDNVVIPNDEVRQDLINLGFLPKGSKATKVTALALRSGWHSGNMPFSYHLGVQGSDFKQWVKRTQSSYNVNNRPPFQVWAEVEVPDDINYQAEADKRGINEKGNFIHADAGMDEPPYGGNYNYKTNPNMEGEWVISGQIKINRILSDEEVAEINGEGMADLPRTEERWDKDYNWENVYQTEPQATDLSKYYKVREQMPELAEIEQYLTLKEKKNLISKQSAQAMLDMMNDYVSPQEMAEVARSGEAKRGWYHNSRMALFEIFGKDHWRFTALLSALSPQTSVESNLENALSIWVAWDKAGRPTAKSKIVDIMEKNVQQQPIVQEEAIEAGRAKKSSVLNAWINNSVNALQATDWREFELSGAKVDSFMRNLWGFEEHVTNDAWMGNYGNVDQAVFANTTQKGKYVGLSINVRKSAEILGWSPAEVQETVWSWAKALYELTEAGDVTAVQALRRGMLTHEMVNDVPDFSKVLREKKYADILKKGGYGDGLKRLGKIEPIYDHSKLTGSVYKKGSKHLLASARRLDELRARRNWENTRNTIAVNISSAVTVDAGKYKTMTGLRNLTKKAKKGNKKATSLLQNIAIDSLNELLPMNHKDFKINVEPAVGLYFGDAEPSVGVSITAKNVDRNRALLGLVQFAKMYDQDAFYMRDVPEPNTPVGHVYPDGSYNTHVVTYEIEKSLTRPELLKIIDESGLAGFTITEGQLQTFYVGNPSDQKAIEAFENATQKAEELLGSNVKSAEDTTQRFWSYGNQVDGAYYTNKYDDVKGRLSTKKEDRPSKTAQRIATHLAGYEVEPAQIPDTITPEQRGLQQEIAVAYENMLVDNMQDPTVKQAYENLASELLEQYDALPVKVEIWNGKGEPYQDSKKRISSKKMRDDVLTNNHIYIYKTTPETFGDGYIFEDHPLLRSTGRTDMNGEPLLYNDLLRAVHDYYAHTMTTAGFGEKGEEVAWMNHMRMTRDPLARWALTSETRGQNSWVNFREGIEDVARKDRPFATQKADLLPVKYAMIGDETLDSQLEGYQKPNKDFNQPMGTEGRRGNIEFTNNETVIRLFESSDLSTFLHEAGHLFLELEGSLAKRRGTLSDDQKAILKWLEVDSFDAIQTHHHEKWARGFEAYLREGKAPSYNLMDSYATYSTWLNQIYKSADELDVVLDDSIRGVMDRMVASEQEINEVTFDDANNELFKDYESAGMTQKEWESLQKQKKRAKDKANQTLAGQLLSELERETKKWWNAELREEKTRQRERLMELPVYQAKEYFKGKLNEDGTNKINSESIQRLTGNTQIPPKMLSMVSKEGTVSIDDAGEMFGFGDGAKLMDAVQKAQPLEKQARQQAEDVLKREHGDILNDGSLKVYAEESAKNEERAKYLLTELKILNRKVKKKPDVDRKEMKFRAKRLVAQTPVSRLTPNRFRRLEVKYAKEAQKAHSQGDINKAIEAKKKQIANFYLYRESLEAVRKAGVIRRRLSAMQRKAYDAKYVEPDYISRLKMFLSAYNFKANGELMAMNQLLDLANWVNTQHQANIQRGVDMKLHLLDPKLQEIVDATTPEQRMSIQLHNYPEMTLEELSGVDAMAQHMLFVGKKVSEDALNNKKRKYDQLQEHIEANAKRGADRSKDDFWVRTRKAIREYASTTFMHAHNMTRWLDGWTDGLVTKSIKMPIDKAVTEKLMPMQEEAGDRMAEIYDRHFTTKELRDYNKRKVAVDGFEESFTKWEVIAVALNMGTESNVQALLNSKFRGELQYPNGRGDLSKILDNMTEKDWAFVQDVWQHINSYWNKISSLEQKLTGVSPSKVEGIPVSTKFGTIQGMYYPLSYDPNKAPKVAENEMKTLADAQQHGRFAQAKTPSGFTQERVGSGGNPVNLNMSVYHQHLNKVVHYLAMSEAVNEVQGIIASQQFRDALDNTDNPELIASLDSWIKDIATGEIVHADIASKAFRRIRTGFSTLAIGWNIGTAMLQPLGLTQTAVVLGVKYTGYGVRKWMANPMGSARFVQAKSKFMYERSGNFNKDIMDTLNQLNRNPNKPSWIPDGLSRSFFKPIVWTQKMVDTATWLGAYEKSRDENPDAPDKDHIWTADRAVARSQASGVFSDRTGIERGTMGSMKQSEWVRMFTALGSYFFNKANLIQEATSDTNFKNPKEILSYVNKMLALVVYETIAYHLMKGTFPDWDDEDERAEIPAFIATQSLYTMGGAFPLVREMFSEIQGFRGGGVQSTFYKQVGDLFKQTKQGEVDKAFLRSVNDMGGIMFRYPSKSVFRFGDELVKDIDGDDFDLLDYFMWREKD